MNNASIEAFEKWLAAEDQADPEPERTYEFDEDGLNQLTKDVMLIAWKASRKQALEEAAAEFDHRADPAAGFYESHEPAEIIRRMK